MGYAFISYSSKNQTEADATRRLFAQNGIQTWMAPNDIPAGSKYAAVIVDALKKCSCLVLLLTKESQESPWVEKEVERAISYGKSVITIQSNGLVLNNCYEYYLCNQQIVYVKRISENSEGIQKVLNAVIALTGRSLENSTHRSNERISEQNPITTSAASPENIPKKSAPTQITDAAHSSETKALKD